MLADFGNACPCLLQRWDLGFGVLCTIADGIDRVALVII